MALLVVQQEFEGRAKANMENFAEVSALKKLEIIEIGEGGLGRTKSARENFFF